MDAPDYLYEYAVVRFVPKVEREEFINVGLLMMCKRHRWIRFKCSFDERKLSCFSSDVTGDMLRCQLGSFDLISRGVKEGGRIASLEVEERFRWLTAVRSACIQTSRPHPGLCDDLEKTFDRLYFELVE